jgi:pimeloyl-ACP methyl ester carboxylesterase
VAAPVNDTILDTRSRFADIGGRLHYLDFGGPAGGPVVVAVHGLGGSALNWSAIAPALTEHCRVLAPDLAGHGLTESLGRSTTVTANRELLHRFVETVAGGPVILLGNSMGGMVSLLEAAAAAESVAGLVLADAVLPLVPLRQDPLVTAVFAMYATPGLGRFIVGRRQAASATSQVALMLRLCCANPSRVPAAIVAEHVELVRRRATFRDRERDFLVAARSLLALIGVTGARGYRRTLGSIAAPVLLLHGDRDRLVPVAAARAIARRHPAWRLVVLPGTGHVPQLEAPAETAAEIVGWLADAGRGAALAASHPLAI